jgi:hypothetical protein
MWTMSTKLLLLLPAALAALADGPGRIESVYVGRDVELTADPQAAHWKKARPVVAGNGPLGKPTPNHRTEIRSLWSDKNLYFLFTCPYEQLHLKENPSKTDETNKLWEWDVAEVFIGADFKNIRQYKEFQVSPQSEWVDLHIDRDKPSPEGGWKWNADGYKVLGRIDAGKKIWYGEMRIPISSIDQASAKPGGEMRINFYRLQGPPPERKGIAWQPTGQRSYHVPEAFGRIVLVK